jgi:hypothetical protein
LRKKELARRIDRPFGSLTEPVILLHPFRANKPANHITHIHMQWLQPPSNPEANEVYRFYLPLITIFP